MSLIAVKVIPYFDDNFSYLITPVGQNSPVAMVDCGDAGPVLDYLEQENLNLDYILLTHSHYDHAGDVETMLASFPKAAVVKSAGEDRIKEKAMEVKDGETIEFGPTAIEIISVPAHTNFCITFKIDDSIFVGDALFSGGCGRLFEGNPENLLTAMDKLSALPDEVNVYFGHEYTEANLRFAHSVEPRNEAIGDYLAEVKKKTSRGGSSTPSTIGLEKRINPFFRIDAESVIEAIDPVKSLSRVQRMGSLRRQKDNF